MQYLNTVVSTSIAEDQIIYSLHYIMCCFYSTIALFLKAEIKKNTFSREKIGKDCLLTLVNWLIVSMPKMAEYTENGCWIHLFTVQSVFCTEAPLSCYN